MPSVIPIASPGLSHGTFVRPAPAPFPGKLCISWPQGRPPVIHSLVPAFPALPSAALGPCSDSPAGADKASEAGLGDALPSGEVRTERPCAQNVGEGRSICRSRLVFPSCPQCKLPRCMAQVHNVSPSPCLSHCPRMSCGLQQQRSSVVRAVLGLNDLERSSGLALGTPTDAITSSEEVRHSPRAPPPHPSEPLQAPWPVPPVA